MEKEGLALNMMQISIISLHDKHKKKAEDRAPCLSEAFTTDPWRKQEIRQADRVRSSTNPLHNQVREREWWDLGESSYK